MSADNVIKREKTVRYRIDRSEITGVWMHWTAHYCDRFDALESLRWYRNRSKSEFRIVEVENVLTERVINEQ